MRVAVAGTCGLALTIAREIHEETSHQLIILSRSVSFPSQIFYRLFGAQQDYPQE
jgi:hypothetical protein